MKKKSLLIFSTSFALGIVALGTGCGLKNEEKVDTTLDDVVLPSDEIGTKIRLGENNSEGSVTTPITFDATLGYRVINETSGAKSVRVYAALNGYKGLKGASLTRKVTGSDGTLVKEEKTMQVNYVYSSIKDANLVTWDTPVSTEITTPYYMVYTLKDIPEEHWLDTVNVSFAIDNGSEVRSGEAIYNVRGLIGDETEGVEYAQRTDVTDKNEYYARAINKTITKAVVASSCYTYEGHVATFMGEVTALDATSNTGAFEGCSSLTEVVLPDSINFFGNYTFYNASALKKVRFPKNLTSISKSAWSNAKFKEVQWDALAFANPNDVTIPFDLDQVTISSEVTSLPKTFMSSSYKIKKVVYDGPLANFNALKTDENKDNGLFVDGVYATDNTINITYHLGEANIAGETGDYVVKSFPNQAFTPATPSLSGKKFDGWYLDENLTTPFDETSILTANTDLYPKFSDFGNGISAEKPIVLGEENASFSETLVPGYEGVYFKYTAPLDSTAKWHYLRINEENSVTNADLSIGVSSLGNQKIFVYKDSVSEENLQKDSSSSYLTDKSNVQKLYSDDGFKRVWIEPGETYYFYADAYYSSYSKDNQWYGDLAIEWKTNEADTIATALSLNYGEEVTPSVSYKAAPVALYKYVATSSKQVAIFLNSYKQYYVNIVCYDATDGNNITKVVEARSKYDTSANVATSTTVMNLVEGHTYVFQASINDKTTDVKYFSFKLDDVPAGASISNAIAYSIGETIKSTDLGLNYVYYSFSLSEEKTVCFNLNGGSRYYAKKAQILSTTGEAISEEVKEVGVEEGSGYWAETYFGNLLSLSKKLEAGTYILKVSMDSSTQAPSDIDISSKYLEAGDSFDDPLVATVVSNSATLVATSDGKFYSFVAANEGYMQFDVTAPDGVKVALLDSNGNAIATASNGGSLVTEVTASQTVVLKAFGASGDATISISYPSEIQDGKSRDTAYALDFSASEEIDITDKTGTSSIDSVFFKFTVSTTGTYRFYSNSESLDSKVNGVYEGEIASKLSNSYNDDDQNKHAGFTNYRYDFYVEVQLEAGKTYYADVKLPANGDAKALKLGLSMLKQGEVLTNPVEKAWDENTLTILSNSKSMFYSFVADESQTYDLTASSSIEGVTPTLTLYKDGTAVKSTGSGYRFTFEKDATYVLNVITSQACDVTITRTIHNGPFTGSDVLGQYNGCGNGSSYYKANIVADGVYWESSTVLGEPSSALTTTATGLTKFVATASGEKTFYCNGTDMWAFNSSYVYFLSKRQSTYTADAVAGEMAKTASATNETGTIIQSIKIDDGTRIYGMSKDGEVYLGITVEFTNGEDIKNDAAFTVKDSSGNTIGTYTGVGGTLTEVTGPNA